MTPVIDGQPQPKPEPMQPFDLRLRDVREPIRSIKGDPAVPCDKGNEFGLLRIDLSELGK